MGFLSPATKKTVRNNEVSVKKAGFDCILQLPVLFPFFSFLVARARSPQPVLVSSSKLTVFTDFTSRLFPHL